VGLPSPLAEQVRALTFEGAAAAFTAEAATQLDDSSASAARAYEARAIQQGTVPFPITEEKLLGYLVHYVHVLGYSSATLQPLMIKLRTAASLRGVWAVSPEAFKRIMSQAVKRLQKERPALITRATAIRDPQLDALRVALQPRAAAGSFRALQQLALLALAYHIGARSINFVDGMGQVRDLEFHGASADGPAGFSFNVRLDKTSQREANGQKSWGDDPGDLSTLQRYVAELTRRGAAAPTAALFPYVRPETDAIAGPSYTYNGLNQLLRDAFTLAGLPSAGVSIHSMRRGRRTDMLLLGLPVAEVNRTLRWAPHSAAAERYDASDGHGRRVLERQAIAARATVTAARAAVAGAKRHAVAPPAVTQAQRPSPAAAAAAASRPAPPAAFRIRAAAAPPVRAPVATGARAATAPSGRAATTPRPRPAGPGEQARLFAAAAEANRQWQAQRARAMRRPSHK